MGTTTSTQNGQYRSARGMRQSPAGRRRPDLDRQARDLLVMARDQFGELERSAAAAADELDRELVRVVEALREEDPYEARRFEAFGESLIEAQRSVAERSAHLRRRLERRGNLETSPRLFGRRADDKAKSRPAARKAKPKKKGDNRPSEGVLLLARHMASTGADDKKIGRVLSRLGVDHADEAVKATFR